MADKVLIWIGEGSDNWHLPFEHLKEWKEYCDDYRAGRVKLNDGFSESHLRRPVCEGKTKDAFFGIL